MKFINDLLTFGSLGIAAALANGIPKSNDPTYDACWIAIFLVSALIFQIASVADAVREGNK